MYVIDPATLTPALDKLKRLTRDKLCSSYAISLGQEHGDELGACYARARRAQCVSVGLRDMLSKLQRDEHGCSHSVDLYVC